MKQNPIKRIKFLMSYDMGKTLNENINSIKIINEDNVLDIDEAAGEYGLVKDLASAASKAERIAHLAQFFKIGEPEIKLGLSKSFKTLGQDLENAVMADLKGGFKGGGNALGAEAKVIAKQKAVKEILSSKKELTETDIVNIIERVKKETKSTALKIETGSGVKAAEDAATAAKDIEGGKIVQTGDGFNVVAKNGSTVNIGTALERTSQESANVLKQDAKVLEGEAKIAAEESAAVVEGIKPNAWQKLKKVAKRLNKKWLWRLGLLSGAAVAGYAIYKYFGGKSNDKIIPCLTDLLDKDIATCSATTAGDPVVIVKTTGRPDLDSKGGVQFYMGGGKQRVLTADQTKRGNFSCKNGTIQTAISEEEETSGDLLQNIQLDWDVAPTKTDDTKPPIPDPNPKVEPSYFDCSKRDITKDYLEWGCISPDLAKLQACYGITPSKGYFGPKTRARLGTNKITPEQYARLMKEKNCYGSDTTSNVTTSDVINTGGGYKRKGLGDKVDKSKFNYLNGQSTDEPLSSSNQTGEPLSSNQTGENPSETGEQLYNRLKSEGLILGDDAITYLEGGTSYGPSRRIKYKGPDLTPNQLMSLDDAISGLGYTRIKQKLEKRYGDKYVWVINK